MCEPGVCKASSAALLWRDLLPVARCSDYARHFSKWCDIYNVAKVVHRDWLDNHCNWSDTLPSILLLELY